MVRRALSLAVPWSTPRRATARSQTVEHVAHALALTLDAVDQPIYMEKNEHNNAPRRLSRQQSTTTSRWRRPSFSTTKRKPPKEDNNSDGNTAPASTANTPASSTVPGPVSASNSTDTTATTTSNSTNTNTSALASVSPGPGLAPAPDSRKEIKKLLRERDDESTTVSDKDSEYSRPMKALEEQAARRQLRAASAIDLHVSSSLIPDSLPVHPLQEIPDAAQFRAKYNIYNPVGPRWYKNHHLIPPHTRIPLSSTFSPAFPPLTTAIGGGGTPMTIDAGGMPILNRTPSNSPLPTPSASQTRLGEGFPPKRTRKISNNAHDNVDLLDATDPWGKNWHHQSPYDVGGLSGPAAQEPPQGRTNGSRTTSAARQNGRLPNPSPLSQSTSAANVAEPPHATVPPRKRTLSKPAVGMRRFFSHSTDDFSKDEKASSAPVTPTDGGSHESVDAQRKLSKRGRTVPPMGTADATTNLLYIPTGLDKKEKRSSFMGRIGKKFSVLRKPLHDHHSFMDWRNEERPERRRERRPSLSSSIREGTVSVSQPRKLSKRIPPSERKEEVARRTSASIDIEFPLTVGNLKIANPDQPSSGPVSPMENGFAASPQSSIAPLPPPKPALPRSPGTETEDDEPPRISVLRVTNTPDHSPENTPDQEAESLPAAPQASQATHPPQPTQAPIHSQPGPEPPLSPLLPPMPLTQHDIPSIPSFFSPGVVSISLSTADFSSPPPPPAKTVDPKSLTDSPRSSEMDMDRLPDIATESDLDRRAETPTPTPSVPPLPKQMQIAMPMPRQQSALRNSVVPFPSSSQDQTKAHSYTRSEKGKDTETDDSPLNRASLYVNPPTPLAHPSSIPFVSPPPPIGARAVPAKQLAEKEAAEERERVRKRELEKEEERAREREREERAKERERERRREKEREEERERERRREKEREEERERQRKRDREWEEERERERKREQREKEKEAEREREREKAARAARRESRKEERTRREDEKEKGVRHEERTSRYEERPRGEERASHYEDRTRTDERVSRYEEKPRHEEKDRSARPSKRDSVDDRGSRKDKKERTSTTETFRLVRSPSENLHYMQGVPTAIPVGQEQWTLVEAPVKRDREKDRSSRRESKYDKERTKEKERTSPEKSSRRRESKREEKSLHGSSRSQRHSSAKEERQRASVSITHVPLDVGLRHRRSQSLDDRHLNGDTRTSDKDKDKDRRTSRKRDSRHVAALSSDSRSSPTGENALANGHVNSGSHASSVERHASLRRAVSDVPAGAEQMMSMTAREAWDADRIWKGKTMYNPEAANIHGGGSNYEPRSSVYSGRSNANSISIPHAVAQGSAYVVQSPYYDPSHASLVHQRSFYAIPVSVAHHVSPPSSHVYPSEATFSPGRYDYPNTYRSYPETLDMNSPPPLANPLPEPPRQAAYSPEPLVLDRQGPSEDPKLTPEYWRVYAGIPTH